jgi:hypothetical protein
MANVCANTISVIGLQDPPETFIKDLSKAAFDIDLDHLNATEWGEDASVNGTTWYASLLEEFRREGVYAARNYILYPEAPYQKYGLNVPRFYVETKWSTPIDELRKASQAFPTLTFHVSWSRLQDGPSGEYIVRNGEVLESIERRGSWYLFDPIVYPSVSLLSAHLPLTLAEHARARLDDAVDLVRKVKNVLQDDRFLHSPDTPFSEARDQEKTANAHAGLQSLLDSVVAQVAQIDFAGVLLEPEELQSRLDAFTTETDRLMRSVGIDCLVSEQGKATRFAIIPMRAAILADPFRAIAPVVHYVNANPATGKYLKQADGSLPDIEWQIAYVCLSRFDIGRLRRLPDQDQTVCDIDLVMTHTVDRSYEFNRVANKARWRLDSEVAARIEAVATQAGDALVAKLANRAGVTIVDDVASWMAQCIKFVHYVPFIQVS